MGRGQVVRHQVLVLAFGGSNPSALAKVKRSPFWWSFYFFLLGLELPNQDAKQIGFGEFGRQGHAQKLASSMAAVVRLSLHVSQIFDMIELEYEFI